MPITVKLDDLLHAHRITLTEFAERIDISMLGGDVPGGTRR